MSDATTTTSAAPAPGSNSKAAFASFMSQVRSLGEASAKGADALPSLAMRVAIASRDGLIDTEEKDADGKDHAARIYEAYSKAESSKAVHSDGGVKANASKLRQIINFGALNLPGFDPATVLERTSKLRKEAKAKKQKVKATYASFVDVARAQIAARTSGVLTDAEILDAINAEGKDKTLIDQLGAVYKKLHDLDIVEPNIQSPVESALTAIKAALAEAGGDPGEFDGSNKAKEKAAKERSKGNTNNARRLEKVAASLSSGDLAALISMMGGQVRTVPTPGATSSN